MVTCHRRQQQMGRGVRYGTGRRIQVTELQRFVSYMYGSGMAAEAKDGGRRMGLQA